MGKKIQQDVKPAQDHKDEQNEVDIQSNKKRLSKFMPHEKYVDLKMKRFRKRLSEAITHVQLDKFQIKKAVECLAKYAEQNQSATDLSGKHETLYISVDVSRVPEQHSVRPIQIKLPFPIYSSEAKSRYTVITSDENEQKFTQTIDALNTPMLKEIISYTNLRKNYKQLKDKRELLAANDLFFCDWKIYNLLRQPLGKLFYEQKKYPYPIDCDGEVPEHLKKEYADYESYINGLASYTYTMLGNGPVYTIKVAKTRMPVREQVKNVMHATYSLIAHILDGKVKPQHIRSVSVKTYNSPSLPFYSFLTKEQIQAYKCKSKQ